MRNCFKFLLVYSLLFSLSAIQNTWANTGYKLGAGDVVKLSVYGQPDLQSELRVDDGGKLDVPLLGGIYVAGYNSADAARIIAKEFEDRGLLKNAHVNLFISEYYSQSVAILGSVNKPGRLFLQGRTSMTEALAWAGGVNGDGSHLVILLRPDKQGRQQKLQFDLQKLLDEDADKQPTQWLQGGDTLYVPVASRFYMRGEVKEPGMYVLDRPINVMQAISISGGLSDRASKGSLTIYRKSENGTVKEMEAKPYDPILDGDVLQVGKSLF